MDRDEMLGVLRAFEREGRRSEIRAPERLGDDRHQRHGRGRSS
jgi:hypothetical protein